MGGNSETDEFTAIQNQAENKDGAKVEAGEHLFKAKSRSTAAHRPTSHATSRAAVGPEITTQDLHRKKPC